MMNLKVISSNIRFENPKDKKHDWPYRKEILQSIIRDFNGDILATQEGRGPQLRDLNRLIPQYQLIDKHREWIPARMYPCLFVNPKTLISKKSGDIWLSETPKEAGSKLASSAFPRLCTWSLIQCKRNSKDFFVANTHLDHLSEKTRIQQVNILIREIRKINSKNLPLILMGDFNDSPNSQVRKDVISKLPLKDPWKLMNLPEESSHHKFLGHYDLGSRIDWVLLSSHFDCQSIFFNKEHRNNIYPSDHFPLMAKIKML